MKVSVAKRIINLLDQSEGRLCDDCIATVLGLGRRQHANAECNRLSAAGRIVREHNNCSQCDQRKLVNGPQDSDASPVPVVSPPKRMAHSSMASKNLDGQPAFTVRGFQFKFVCSVDPDRNGSQISVVTPRMTDAAARGLSLHRYGDGPFCRFRVPSEIKAEGVYLMVSDDQILYVGRCDNFSDRFNIGYGQISPRNCYEGGQQTNCRINNQILNTVVAGTKITLWFLPTIDSVTVEAALIGALNPPWNAKRGSATL